MGRAVIYLLDLESKSKTPLIESQHGDFLNASWYPDGNAALVTIREGSAGFDPSGVWKIDIATGAATYLIDAGIATWSPDGHLLAIAKPIQSDGSVRGISIEVFDPVTRTTSIVHADPRARYAFGLTWSPEGDSIVTALGNESLGDLLLLGLADGTPMQLTQGERSSDPAWSAKYNLLAYVSWPSSGSDTSIGLITPDGSCSASVPDKRYVWSPTWSPDGSALAYVGPDGIYVMDFEQVGVGDPFEQRCT